MQKNFNCKLSLHRPPSLPYVQYLFPDAAMDKTENQSAQPNSYGKSQKDQNTDVSKYYSVIHSLTATAYSKFDVYVDFSNVLVFIKKKETFIVKDGIGDNITI